MKIKKIEKIYKPTFHKQKQKQSSFNQKAKNFSQILNDEINIEDIIEINIMTDSTYKDKIQLIYETLFFK